MLFVAAYVRNNIDRQQVASGSTPSNVVSSPSRSREAHPADSRRYARHEVEASVKVMGCCSRALVGLTCFLQVGAWAGASSCCC
jgi:hypothetical protein